MNNFYVSVITKKIIARKLLISAVLLFVCFRLFAQTVTTAAQLRTALTTASNTSGTSTIIVKAGTYFLTSEINIGNTNNQTINIIGDGATSTFIDGSSIDRIFVFNTSGGTTGLTINLSGVTLRNGKLTSDAYGGGAILGGGPTNVYTINNCIISNNTISTTVNSGNGTNGGAVALTGGGAVTINNSIFTGNSNPKLTGGAIYFSLQFGESGSLTINKCTFTSNSAPVGGAISIATNQPYACSITENNFTANTATNMGGAIAITNANSGNTANINYNRFYGNTATANPAYSAVEVANGVGNVNLANNWWGCNSGPSGCADKAAAYIQGTGTNTFTPYLTLRTSAASTPICIGATSVITSDFTMNSNNATIATTNLDAFTGLALTFTATSGSVSPTSVSITGGGAATSTFTGGTAGTGTVTTTIDNASVTTSNITVNAATSFSAQPATTTNVCSGSNTTIVAAATGAGTISYQWYKNSTLLNNGGSVSGATTGTLSITSAGSSDAATYYVIATGTCGSLQSNNAVLAVNAVPSIATAPNSTSICAGNTAQFTTTGAGAGTLSYQWYKGATALTNGATGNGSTISGATTATLTFTNTTAADAASTYNVKISSTTGCTVATSANVTLTVNTSPSITTAPATTVTGCAGNTVTFTAAATGSPTPTYQWTKSGSPLSNGTTATGSYVTNATGTTLTITNAQVGDNATYNFVATNTCTTATSGNSVLTISSSALSSTTGTNSGTQAIGSNTAVTISNTSCVPLANIVQSGVSPVTGSITASSTFDATVLKTTSGSYYVQRHYDITPATNAATATATITLYYLQSDFNAYNAVPAHGAISLPFTTADPENNKINIRIGQYHGTGTAPGNYTGTGVVLTPSNVVYNSAAGRWEVTVDVTGFSGFYLSNPTTVLPLNLLSFTGTAQSGNALLQWNTSNEVNTSYFEILRSTNGVDFTNISQLPTTGNGSTSTNNYQYKDALGSSPVYYYELKMVDKDGKATVSNIVSINNQTVGGAGYIVRVTPNPFQSKVLVNVTALQDAQLTLELVDINGKKLTSQTATVKQGNNTITIDALSNMAHGTYMLHLFNNNMNQTIKLIKIK